MNILAHLYLSGEIDEGMLGNYMGDFVKGKSYLNYPEAIQEGILLHRQIDTFADNHTAHKSSRDRFRKGFGLYSGVVVDIVYDYFLASQWSKYHPESLDNYSQRVYQYLERNNDILPVKLQQISPYLIKNNWFLMYQSFIGIEKVLIGMTKRTSLPNNVNFAMHILEQYESDLNNEFQQIIRDLFGMVKNKVIISEFTMKNR